MYSWCTALAVRLRGQSAVGQIAHMPLVWAVYLKVVPWGPMVPWGPIKPRRVLNVLPSTVEDTLGPPRTTTLAPRLALPAGLASRVGMHEWCRRGN